MYVCTEALVHYEHTVSKRVVESGHAPREEDAASVHGYTGTL